MQGVRDIKEAIAGFAPAKRTTLQTIALVATVAGGTATAVVGAYSFWPTIEVLGLPGEITADPLTAKFQFRNISRYGIDGAVISCEVKSGSRKMTTSGNTVKEPTGNRGQVLGWMGSSSPPIVRTCGLSAFVGFTHPASVEIDVDWHFLTVGHQYFISQRAPDGKCCLMVPESDALPR